MAPVGMLSICYAIIAAEGFRQYCRKQPGLKGKPRRGWEEIALVLSRRKLHVVKKFYSEEAAIRFSQTLVYINSFARCRTLTAWCKSLNLVCRVCSPRESWKLPAGVNLTKESCFVRRGSTQTDVYWNLPMRIKQLATVPL